MKKEFLKSWQVFIKKLQAWYHPDNRKLPWKGIKDPYLIWISEIFLQQTQADRVVEFYLRFTAKFPTVQKLAKASFEQALPYFRGLGYYSRLRRMLVTAEIIVREFDGKFPSEIELLKKLPGIGEYTARAIASFAFGQKVIAPDTNVKRVIERFFGTAITTPSLRGTKQSLHDLDRHYPKDLNLNQALMDLGAEICLARAPKCVECPLMKGCLFARNPRKLERDSSVSVGMEKLKSPRNYQKVVVGILIQGKKILVSRRKEDQDHSGFLEFPGGKVDLGEDQRQAMQREFLEEVGVEVSVRPHFQKVIDHGKKLVLYFHRCRILTGVPRSMEQQEVFWLEQEKLDPEEFVPANKGVVEGLKKGRL